MHTHTPVDASPVEILRASVLLPVGQPPIEDGALAIAGRQIIQVGRWADIRSGHGGRACDLGDALLLPGLVNAHCHLDYTDLAGLVPPTKDFPDWLKALLSWKAQWSYTDFAQSWLHGARMLLRHGVTTVADMEAVPELLPEVRSSTPMRIFSFLEMTGVKSRRPPQEILDEALRRIESLPSSPGGAGLAPHAPYSTRPELLRLSADTARQRGWKLAIHVAESKAEFDMFAHQDGPLYEWLKTQRDMDDCGLGSPVQHLNRLGALSADLMAIHVNYLAPGDAELLGRREVSVVHCPRSHAYFQHGPFPLQELAGAGANLCLGTDSLASVEHSRRRPAEFSVFAEMQTLAARQPGLDPETILRMATVNGAQALGLSGRVGELREGAFADCIVLPLSGKPADPYELALNHRGPVLGSMIDGQWAVPPPN